MRQTDKIMLDDLSDVRIVRTVPTPEGCDVEYSVAPLHVPRRLVLLETPRGYRPRPGETRAPAEVAAVLAQL